MMVLEAVTYIGFPMNDIALITGITGQDGAYLAKSLLEKRYIVYGAVQDLEKSNFYKLKHLGIEGSIKFVEVNLMVREEVIKLLLDIKPTQIYNLASQSSVGKSNFEPYDTILFNATSVLNLLESIRLVNSEIRFFHALSSEIFGKVKKLPISEATPINPENAYAASKVSNYYLIKVYRDFYNIFAASGILFNHESVLRSGDFFIKKVIRGAVRIKLNKQTTMEFGDLNIKRDFGCASKYMDAAYLMLQAEEPDDFIIASGKSIYLQEIVDYVFEKLKIHNDKFTSNNSHLIRKNDVKDSYGTSFKIRSALGWDYDKDFFTIVDEMMDYELNREDK